MHNSFSLSSLPLALALALALHHNVPPIDTPALLPRALILVVPQTPENKPRLYVALYPRAGSSTSFVNHINCDSCHWSLILAPETSSRTDPGTRYHIAHTNHPSQSFLYEEEDIPSCPVAQTALVRVTVAKITSAATAEAMLRSIPIPSPEDDLGFNCLAWTKRAFAALVDDKAGCAKSYVSADDWTQIEECARKYVKRKREQRRFTDPNGPWDLACVSTFNFWENRETTP